MTIDENWPFCSSTFTFEGDRLYAMGLFDDMLIVNRIGCFSSTSGKINISIGDSFNRLSLSLDPPSNTASCLEGEFDGIWIEKIGESFIDYDGQNASAGDNMSSTMRISRFLTLVDRLQPEQLDDVSPFKTYTIHFARLNLQPNTVR